MNKIIPVLMLLLLVVTGCSTTKKLTAADIAGRVPLGLPIQEFLAIAGPNAEMESMTLAETVYRINEYESFYNRDAPGGRQMVVSGAKLFYFDSSGRLYRIDSRILQPSRNYRVGGQGSEGYGVANYADPGFALPGDPGYQ